VASSPDGGALTYQWYSNTIASNVGGTPIAEATHASFDAPIDMIGIFFYYVVVTNTISDNGDGGIKTATLSSNVAILTVSEDVGRVTIHATVGDGGRITPAGIIKVSIGSAQTFVITPNVGFRIETVLVDGVNQPASVTSGTYTFYNLNVSHTIHATFVRSASVITATVEGSGKITPAGTITVALGKSQTFIFTPNSGFMAGSVLINGVALPTVPANSMYTFTNLQGDQTIHVIFVPKPKLDVEENDGDDVVIYSHLNTVYIKTNVEMWRAASPSTVEIYDMTGRRVHNAPITDVETVITLNVATGIYSVRIISQNETVINRKVSITR
jgi:hypothetical protein